MKKALSILFVLCFLLASCAKTGQTPETGLLPTETGIGAEQPADGAFDYENADLTKYVRLGQIEGLSATKMEARLTDEEFEGEIDAMLDAYAHYPEITDRAVEEGDVVRADYAGYLNGEAFAGGTATDQEITAAGGTGYIEGFAEAFIGQMPDGSEFSFNVTFPEDYGNEMLNGQEVTFKCRVHAILGDEMILPELTDEFVRENFSCDSVEEFREIYRESVQKKKTYYVEGQVYAALWEQIVNGAEMLAYPEEEVERVYQGNRTQYETYAAYYGVDYETFLKSYANRTDDDMREDARRYVKEDIVMYALKKALGVEPTEQQYADGIDFLAEYNNMSVDEIKEYYGEDTLRVSVLWELIMKQVAQTAVITPEAVG